jgi:hypothetical protein
MTIGVHLVAYHLLKLMLTNHPKMLMFLKLVMRMRLSLRNSPLVVIKARDVGCLILTKVKGDAPASQIGLQKDLVK